MRCPACDTVVAETSDSCPSCGVTLTDPNAPTVADRTPTPPARPRTSGSRPPSSAPLSAMADDARFIPGTLLAERYRIVGLLGRGGMGEVYRADDLKLGQAVALKFLPPELLRDEEALRRFHREARVARQVSHPNVCRVFDIGEVDSQQFLSMEYIDGEDLGSLLRRIGRLPEDKALEIARQLCAGLAAAHDAGVLHRDLKPSNVMIDGRGRARITDFGLAGLAEEFQAGDVRAGTPTYMAPEQLRGQEVTVRSDIFSLGLVLYEMFTGRRVYEAQTIQELMRLHEQSAPSGLSSVVRDIDPAVERAILRCLHRNPQARPAAALQVAAALPGGDPLAAALAAGETPSPELVAASGQTEGLRPAWAWACLGLLVVLMIALVWMADETKLYTRVSLDKPPAVLAERAREILGKAGFSEPIADTAASFSVSDDFLEHLQQNDKSAKRWDRIAVEGMILWYRTSPRPLEFLSFFGSYRATPSNPPLVDSGMTLVRVDPQGRLITLVVVPPQRDEKTETSDLAPGWAAMFSEAGLDLAKWTPATPQWAPPVYADTRAAWTGSLPDWPEVEMRIEAAAYRGRPVYFERIGPWTRPSRMQDRPVQAGERIAQAIGIFILATLMVGGLLLARRNLKLGRGDRRGAARLAITTLIVLFVSWLLSAQHVSSFWELALFVMFLGWGLFVSGFVWILYIALEPLVRRRWPTALISWTRVLAGKWRDPVVGRDALLGFLTITAILVQVVGVTQLSGRLGLPPPYLASTNLQLFLGAPHVIATLLQAAVVAIFGSMAFLFLLFILRLLLRRGWAAGVAFVIIISAGDVVVSETPWIEAVHSVFVGGLLVLLLLRLGLFAVTASMFFSNLLNFPITTDFSAWYAGTGLAALSLAMALAFAAFYLSLGGRPMFGAATLED